MTSPPPSRAADGSGGRRLPRWLLALGVPIAGLLLVTAFVFVRFPFDRFRDTLALQLGQAIGAEVAIGELEPSLGLRGPGFVAKDARIRWPDGERASVARAALHPAWSPSWLSGTPALHLDADSDLGAVVGVFTTGDAPAFDGELVGVDTGRLPLERLFGGARFDGRLDFEGALELRPAGPVGDARFEARDGSVSALNLPIAVPYDVLGGRIRFGDDGSVALEGVRLDGPMLSATAEGGTGPGPSLLLAPLDLAVHLEVSDRNIRPALRSAGIRLKPDGTVDLTIRGTLATPIVR